MTLIGYARVSSQNQDLRYQLDKLKEAGCKKVFSGKHSGKADTNKEQLEALIDYVREGDVVLVTKLDRFGRSLSQVLNALDRLTEKGVALKALDQPIDTSASDPMSKAMVHLLGMFAEMERNFIATRTTEGRIKSGRLGGRPKSLTEEQRSVLVKEFHNGSSKASLAIKFGVSRATVMRYIGSSKKTKKR